MKSLFRWGATLGLVGTTMVSSWLGGNLKALALPEEQIVKTLQSVPVFAIADEKGVPLIAVVENDKKVTGVFISRKDAQDFLAQLQKENPDVAKKVTVQPVSLGQVYKLQAAQKEPDGILVSYVPSEQEVEAAKKLLGQSGQEYKGGVPLYVATAGEGQYLTMNMNNNQVIPFFFEKAAVTNLVEAYKKQKPDIASTIKIEVIPLESVLATMTESNDEMLTKILLYPSQETLNYIRSTSQNSGNNQPKN